MIYFQSKHKAAALSIGKRVTRIVEKQSSWNFKDLRYMDKETKETLKRVQWTTVGPEELCKWKS